MRSIMSKTIGAAAAALVGALAVGVSTASAGVTGCSAPGGKQEAGAKFRLTEAQPVFR